jgi:hypothetical protein
MSLRVKEIMRRKALVRACGGQGRSKGNNTNVAIAKA